MGAWDLHLFEHLLINTFLQHHSMSNAPTAVPYGTGKLNITFHPLCKTFTNSRMYSQIAFLVWRRNIKDSYLHFWLKRLNFWTKVSLSLGISNLCYNAARNLWVYNLSRKIKSDKAWGRQSVFITACISSFY